MGYLENPSVEAIQEAIAKAYSICKSKKIQIGIAGGAGIP